MSFKNQRMQRHFSCLGYVTATAFLQTNSWTSSLKTGSQWPAVRNAGRTCWKDMPLCCQRSKWQSCHYLFRHTIAPAELNLLERLHTLYACSATLPSRNSRLPCPCNLLPASYHLPILLLRSMLCVCGKNPIPSSPFIWHHPPS